VVTGKSFATDIVGIETNQFNQLINALQEVVDAVDDVQSDTGALYQHKQLLQSIDPNIDDANNTLGAIEEQIDILAALMVQNNTSVTGAIDTVVQAIAGLGDEEPIDVNVTVTVTVDQGQVVLGLNDVQGAITNNTNMIQAEIALLVGAVNQLKASVDGILVSPAMQQMFTDIGFIKLFTESGMMATANLHNDLGHVFYDAAEDAWKFPDPVNVNVIGGELSLEGNGSLDDLISAVENIGNSDGNGSQKEASLNSVVADIVAQSEVVRAAVQTAADEVEAGVGLLPSSPTESNNGLGTLIIDLPTGGGGTQSYDLFNASMFSSIPNIETVGNWIKLVLGLYLLFAYVQFNWGMTIDFAKVQLQTNETNQLTNYGGSLGGIVTGWLKAARITLVVIFVPVVLGMIALVNEVNFGGGAEHVSGLFNAGLDAVIGGAAPAFAQKAWDYFCVFIPVETAFALFSSACSIWLGIYMYALVNNRVLRVLA